MVVGIGVVALGAVVLLLFPDRPGGKIAWQGAEVSSIGAGLPLIVVGIVAIALAGGGVIGGDDDDGGTANKTTSGTGVMCPDELRTTLPPERVADVEVGAHDQIIIGLAASKTEPFGLRLTADGETVGAIAARFFPASGLFKVQSLVDADCQAGDVLDPTPGKGRLQQIRNYNDVRIDLAGRSFLLNLDGSRDIRVNFYNYVP
jgi:hypothetical protein